MKYELFVIKEGNRNKVELGSANVSLKFNSCLFKDLSKITCSHSYTFTIPMSVCNRRIFDSIEDIRYSSTMYGKRIDAELLIDGVNVCKNGLLYVSSVNNGYSCVLTWDVAKGLQEMRDNDASIRTLESLEAQVFYGKGQIDYDPFDNDVPSIPAIYDNGTTNSFGFPTLPAVPAYRILKAIEGKYGQKINIGRHITNEVLYPSSDKCDGEDIVNYGCIPLVSRNAQQEEDAAIKELPKFEVQSSRISDYPNLFPDGEGRPSNRNLISFTNLGNSNKWFSYLTSTITARRDFTIKISVVLSYYASQGATTTQPFYLYHLTKKLDGGYIYTQISECSATSDENVLPTYRWDLNEEVEVKTGDVLFFCCPSSFHYDIKLDGYMAAVLDPKKGDYYISVCDNLPDVSCFNFVKSLFFQMGAFPKVNTDGSISPVFYTEFKNNISKGNVYDWSRYIIGDVHSEVSFSMGEIGQKSFYLMKNESLDSEQDGDDRWVSNMFSVDCDNKTLEPRKQIYQFPYYASYAGNINVPEIKYYTTNAIKQWNTTVEDKYAFIDTLKYKVEATEAKPAFGYIYNSYKAMTVWDMSKSGREYEYVNQIVKRPYVVSIRCKLNPFILRDLNYAKPVYIERLNSFFAIVSINTDNNGISKVELLKLP